MMLFRFVRQLMVVCFLGTIAGPVMAQDESPVIGSASLRPELALRLAQAARDACRARDMQVSVAVVDRSGAAQVTLRDALAGNFTHKIALQKAITAAGFRQPTLGLAEGLPRRSELQAIDRMPGILMVGGGIPVEYNGAVVGAVGVSGAPTPQTDHDCAQAGIEALDDVLLF